MTDTKISEQEARQRVPPGPYCYRMVHVEGRDLKEFEDTLQKEHPDHWFSLWLEQTRPVYCPYWSTTDYGTVRCSYLGVEAVGISEEYWELAVQHFGSDDAVLAACTGNLLGDAVKECGLNRED